MKNTKKYHYIYALKRLSDGAYYIGVRSCTCEPELDTKYMSSSRTVRAEIKAGERYKKKILSVWPTRKKALQEEIRLHAKHDVARSDKFLNLAKQTSVGFNREGIPHNDETLKKLHNLWTDERREAWGERNSGENNPRHGTRHTEKTKAKMRKSWTSELRENASARQRENNVSTNPEVAAKIAAALKGKKKSAAHCQAMRDAKTPEARAKISEALAGTVWITDGATNKRVKEGTKMPRGFRLGKLPEPKYTHPRHKDKLLMRSHWKRWANENLDSSKVEKFMNQLVKEN
jgi:hypothetical protein